MDKKGWRSLVRRQRRVLYLILTILLVNLIVNLLSSWLVEALGSTPWRILQMALGVAVVALAIWAVLRLADEQAPVQIVPHEERSPRSPGLLALVGPGREGSDPLDQAAGIALRHHLAPEGPGEPLRTAWLVTGRGERGGVAVAERYREQWKAACPDIRVCTVADPLNLQETYALVERIYLEDVPGAGLKPEQVVADLTGGTSIMTAGVALACRDRWPMEYVTGRAGTERAPVLVRWQPSGTGKEA